MKFIIQGNITETNIIHREYCDIITIQITSHKQNIEHERLRELSGRQLDTKITFEVREKELTCCYNEIKEVLCNDYEEDK